MGDLAASPAAEAVQGELLCFGCLYDLRGQPADGLCPECGAGVAASRRPDRWDHADVRWRRRVARGVGVSAMVYLAIPMGMVADLTSWVPSEVWSLLVYGWMAGCTLVGGWWAGSPEPGARPGVGRWVRALSVAAALAYGLALAAEWEWVVLDLGGLRWHQVTMTLMAAAAGSQGTALLAHARALARRVPGRRRGTWVGAAAVWAPALAWGSVVAMWYVEFRPWMEFFVPVAMLGLMGVGTVYEVVLWWALRVRRG